MENDLVKNKWTFISNPTATPAFEMQKEWYDNVAE